MCNWTLAVGIRARIDANVCKCDQLWVQWCLLTIMQCLDYRACLYRLASKQKKSTVPSVKMKAAIQRKPAFPLRQVHNRQLSLALMVCCSRFIFLRWSSRLNFSFLGCRTLQVQGQRFFKWVHWQHCLPATGPRTLNENTWFSSPNITPIRLWTGNCVILAVLTLFENLMLSRHRFMQ